MLGTDVTFEKLNFSLLGGSVEAQGVTVAGDDPSAPFLTIRRVRAEIALGAAIKKQFVIKSLTIEKPVVVIVRDADGKLNLPRRFQPDDAPASQAASDTGGQTSDSVADADAGDEAAGNWKFEARKVLVVDGEVHFRDASGYHASLEQILGEVKEAENGQEFTLIVDTAARRDQPADLGQIRLHGRADNVPDLSQWQRASVRATLDVAEALQVRLHAPSVQPIEATAEIKGSLDLAALAAFVPEEMKALQLLRSGTLRGRVEVNGRASYDVEQGLRLPELALRAIDLAFGAPDNHTVG